VKARKSLFCNCAQDYGDNISIMYPVLSAKLHHEKRGDSSSLRADGSLKDCSELTKAISIEMVWHDGWLPWKPICADTGLGSCRSRSNKEPVSGRDRGTKHLEECKFLPVSPATTAREAS
jgi:hypothetical protein